VAKGAGTGALVNPAFDGTRKIFELNLLRSRSTEKFHRLAIYEGNINQVKCNFSICYHFGPTLSQLLKVQRVLSSHTLVAFPIQLPLNENKSHYIAIGVMIGLINFA
jgi:hypothetical protein